MSRQKLVIAGASGVIGRCLVERATEHFQVLALSRGGEAISGADVVRWNPAAARQNDEATLERLSETLAGAAAVVNLAGASIGNGRFGSRHRERILQSRLDSTKTLAAAHNLAPAPAAMWLQASGIHYYGDRGDQVLDETCSSGDGFMSEVCRAWEGAAGEVDGARVVCCRFGLVLAQRAPLWRRMTLPIRLGAGGPLGPGTQWWAWLHGEDVARALLHVMAREDATGAYNVTAPQPVRQRDFVRAVARRLRRPAIFPTPATLLRIVLGGAADALVLASTRAVPERLLSEGFTFSAPDVESALDKLLSNA